MDVRKAARVSQALEKFRIELPSWGFTNTGTRFGKFLQPAAASTAATWSATNVEERPLAAV